MQLQQRFNALAAQTHQCLQFGYVKRRTFGSALNFNNAAVGGHHQVDVGITAAGMRIIDKRGIESVLAELRKRGEKI